MSAIERVRSWAHGRCPRRVRPSRYRPRIEGLEGRRVPAVLVVGPAEIYKLPSQAAAAAHDGDTIQIQAGTYRNDTAIWRANNLTIEGVGGRPKMDDTGYAISNRKGIWVVDGNNTTISNVELVGAHDAAGLDKNWAGIRLEGTSLTLSNSYIHGNDDGLLTGANANSDVTVTGTEFASNGYGDGYSHNMYIGQVRSFTLQFSYSHDAIAGHLVKSRAQTNKILYNRLIGGNSATTSFELDLPNGGLTYVIGNNIEQGATTGNSTILAYAEEGASNSTQQLYVVNNTFVNDRHSGIFVQVSGTPAADRLINNIFAGGGTVLSGTGTQKSNLVSNSPGFVNQAAYDYTLVATSPAINAGTAPGTVNGFDLTPRYQYTTASGWVARPAHGAIDIGAYEY